jgi:hypothetical protein
MSRNKKVRLYERLDKMIRALSHYDSEDTDASVHYTLVTMTMEEPTGTMLAEHIKNYLTTKSKFECDCQRSSFSDAVTFRLTSLKGICGPSR